METAKDGHAPKAKVSICGKGEQVEGKDVVQGDRVILKYI